MIFLRRTSSRTISGVLANTRSKATTLAAGVRAPRLTAATAITIKPSTTKNSNNNNRQQWRQHNGLAALDAQAIPSTTSEHDLLTAVAADMLLEQEQEEMYNDVDADLPKSAFLEASTYASLEQPMDVAVSLIPSVYKSKACLSAEKDAVFYRSWIPAALTNIFGKNEFATTSTYVGDVPVIITKDGDQYRAFHNVCRHRGSKLCADFKTSATKGLSCPYHAWVYDLKGNLKRTPRFKSDSFVKSDYGLFPIDCEVFGTNVICVNLRGGKTPSKNDKSSSAKAAKSLEVKEEQAANMKTNNSNTTTTPVATKTTTTTSNKKHNNMPSVNECYGDAAELFMNYPLNECELAWEGTYTAKANWKLLVENFAEYYHLHSVHPELAKVSRVEDHHATRFSHNIDYPIQTGDTIPMGPGVECDTAHFVTLFPNWFCFLFPDHMFSVFLQPVSPTRTIEHASLIVHPSSKANVDEIIRFYDMVNKQDIEICERVQAGLNSPMYTGGRFVPEMEYAAYEFQKMYADKMTAPR